MRIKLIWQDPNSQQIRQPILETPISFGRIFEQMPQTIDDQRVSRMSIEDDSIEPFHALIEEREGKLIISSHSRENKLEINGVQLSSSALLSEDLIRLGIVEIKMIIPELIDTGEQEKCSKLVGFLIKRRCNRIDRTDCPYCATESIESDRDELNSFEEDELNLDFSESDSDRLEMEINEKFELDLEES